MFLAEIGVGSGIHYLQTPLVVRLPGRVVPLKLNLVLKHGLVVLRVTIFQGNLCR